MVQQADEVSWHRNGVRQGQGQDNVPLLPATAGMERNLLCVPLFVLHAKSARALQQLKYSWPLKGKGDEIGYYTLSRTGDNPFPLTQHALYLDILLAMFAVSFRKDGVLYFRISDVLRAAGKNPDSHGAREAVVEAIRRYMTCHVMWELCWHGHTQSWAGAIISASNLWEEGGNPVTGRSQRNPRNSRAKDQWHMVKFHEYVVDSIRDGNTRIILTSIMGSGIPHDAFCVYRYFYGFSDRTEVRRWFDQLMQAFPWTSQKNRFPIWLEKQLKQLLARDLIDYYRMAEEWVAVKCKPIEELQKHQKAMPPPGTVEVVHEDVPDRARPVNEPPQPRQSAARGKRKTTVANLTDEALLAHYFALRDASKLEPHIVEMVDELIAKRLRDIYVPALRSYLDRTSGFNLRALS